MDTEERFNLDNVNYSKYLSSTLMQHLLQIVCLLRLSAEKRLELLKSSPRTLDRPFLSRTDSANY